MGTLGADKVLLRSVSFGGVLVEIIPNVKYKLD